MELAMEVAPAAPRTPRYFAAREASEVIGRVSEHTDRHEAGVEGQHGIGAIWRRNMAVYYSGFLSGNDSTALDFGGKQGELVKVVSNQARSLARQFFALITKARLEFEASAQTTESGVIADARLANALCKHVVEDQQLDSRADRMLETTIIAGSAYLKPCWRTDRGKRVARAQLSGALEISVHHPIDVTFDLSVEHAQDRDWCVVRTVKNRWDLAAQFPELEEKIANLPAPRDDQFLVAQERRSEDLCFVYEFYHRSTVAMPEGRMLVFGCKETVFYDAPNPYIDQDGEAFLPLVECKPEPVVGTPWGYSFFNDLVPLQEMFDAAMSTAASNVSAYGFGTLLNPEGNGLSVTDIGGLQFLNYKPAGPTGGGKPEPLALPSTPAEVYKFSETVKTNMMEISGINSTLRGAPPSNVTSGTMAATLSANAVEFAAPFAKAYHLALEQVLYYSLLIYKRFATVPQVISVVGKNRDATVKEFVGSDIGNIARVSLRVRNAASSTAAGVADQGEKLLNAGLIRSPQQFIELMETGNIESLFETEQKENDLINAENDLLREGKIVHALATDVHTKHIPQHIQVLSDPELRRQASLYMEGADPGSAPAKAAGILKAALDHVNEHLGLQKNTDPMLLAICATGQVPQIPPGAPPPPALDGGGAPPPSQGDLPASPAQPAPLPESEV